MGLINLKMKINPNCKLREVAREAIVVNQEAASVNMARRTAVTHQSFSMTSRCRMFSSEDTRSSISTRSSFDKSMNFIAAISFLPTLEQARYHA